MQKRPHSIWLRPLSALYGVGVRLRTMLFDRGILREEAFPIPIICVGNLAVGGTGKTPHVEYIVSILSTHYRVAVLSRGYKRRTKGLYIATPESKAVDIGDEPKQIKQKYPHVIVAVDANRRRGIRHLLSWPKEKQPEVIVLDDGFQHRYVKASLSILLTDYHSLFVTDTLLPAGRLRESAQGKYRADCVVVSRCPTGMQPIEQRITERSLGLYPHQQIFFSEMKYAQPQAVFPEVATDRGRAMQSSAAFALAGIANPEKFFDVIAQKYKLVVRNSYADHHHFSISDASRLNVAFGAFLGNTPENDKPIAICTEKDAQRLRDIAECLSPALRRNLYYLPMHVAIKFDKATDFERLILSTISHSIAKMALSTD